MRLISYKKIHFDGFKLLNRVQIFVNWIFSTKIMLTNYLNCYFLKSMVRTKVIINIYGKLQLNILITFHTQETNIDKLENKTCI